MKILHIVHWPKTGITRMVEQIIKYTNNNYKNYVLLLNRDIEYDRKLSTICFHNKSIGNNKSILSYYREVRTYINYVNPDVVHTHSFSPAIYASCIVRKAKHITTIHNDYPYFYDEKLKSCAKREIWKHIIKHKVRYVSCVSKAIRTKITAICGYEAGNIITIYNGIKIDDNMPNLDLSDLRKEINADDDTILITSIGRLHEQKGYHILLKAIAIVINVLKDKKIKLLIVGEGEKREELVRMIDNYKLHEFVNLIGYKSNPYYYLKISNIYVSSSVYEGLPLSIEEAMFFCLPVIATNVGGVSEIIDNNIDGFLVEPNDFCSLSDKIISTVKKLNSIKHIGINANKKIIDKFNIDKTVESYCKLYEQVVK